MAKNTQPLANPYGYYDAGAREYVITRPDTPTPWFNYIGEGRYGGIVSNAAGGFAFDRDPKNRRVSRYRYNAIPADQPGRYVYLRDMQSGKFWSPTAQPTPAVKLAEYECRHGAGYTKITGTRDDIQASVLYFVPPSPETETCPCELWVLKVKNVGKRARKLRTFSYVEFSFRDTLGDQLNLDWCQHILEATVKGGIITSKTRFADTTNYFASSSKPCGFETDREIFVGRFRDLANPEMVAKGVPTNTAAPRGNNIGCLCHDLTLRPGETKEIVYVMGVTDEPARIAKVVERWRKKSNVTAAFAALKADWDDYLGRFTVETPDPVVNAMLNVWNPIQCRTTLFWSRFVSAYETGTGRGMGTRDSAQDTLGTVHNAAARAKSTLNMLWHLQYQDGHTWHQVLPLTGEGGPGLAAEFPQWPQWFSDDHLWLILGVCAYLRETGDLDYLDHPVAYWDGGEDTIWNHMLRGVEFTLQHRGPHGLPRIGFSDWDDTMNVDHGSGKAESVWVAQHFCRAMLDLAELSDHIGATSDAERFRRLHKEMAEIVNQVAWDGEWYARAFDDEGQPIGVKAEAYQKIALNTQTWAVIGEAAPPDRAWQAMDSAHKHLHCEYGLALLVAGLRQGRRAGARHHDLPAGSQGERRRLLPRQHLGHRRGGQARHGRAGHAVLPRDHALHAHRPRRHEGRALRLLRQRHRPRAQAAGPRAQRVAVGYRLVDLRRGHAVDPRHPADLPGPDDRPHHPGEVARLQGDARLPRCALRHQGRAARQGQHGLACRGRQAHRRRGGAAAPGRDQESKGRGRARGVDFVGVVAALAGAMNRAPTRAPNHPHGKKGQLTLSSDC